MRRLGNLLRLLCAVQVPAVLQAVLFGGQAQDDIGEGRAIPNRFLFNFKVNLLKGKKGFKYEELRRNLKQTLGLYNGVKDISFIDDAGCVEEIRQAHSNELAEYVKVQQQSLWTSDICRLAQLKNKGGYYFDNDMIAVSDLRQYIPKNATFVSSVAVGGSILFNSLIAATPDHPIIDLALQRTWRRIRQKKQAEKYPTLEAVPPDGMGFQALTQAYIQYARQNPRHNCSGSDWRHPPFCPGSLHFRQRGNYSDVYLFEEVGQKQGGFEKYGVKDPPHGVDKYFVGDNATNKMVFWSRRLSMSRNDKAFLAD